MRPARSCGVGILRRVDPSQGMRKLTGKMLTPPETAVRKALVSNEPAVLI
jgi:hypothetical protein